MAYITDIDFQMLHVDWVEANNGGVKPDVNFGQVNAVVVWSRI